ncbi:MAG: hypothetical protein ACK5LC_15445 [Coprobacillaceae bacterium]
MGIFDYVTLGLEIVICVYSCLSITNSINKQDKDTISIIGSTVSIFIMISIAFIVVQIAYYIGFISSFPTFTPFDMLSTLSVSYIVSIFFVKIKK